MKYANIIVDISLEKLDKTFQYLVPEELNETLRPGMQVVIPFGSRKITGYILELTDTAMEIYPFDEWQSVKIDALMGMNRYKEAYQLYDAHPGCSLKSWESHLRSG